MSDLGAVLKDLWSRRKKPTRVLAGAAIYESIHEAAKVADLRTGKRMRWGNPNEPTELLLMGLPVVLCETMEPDAWLMDPTV